MEVRDSASSSSGTGSGDTTMTFAGTAADINNALDGMTFSPTTGFAGAATGMWSVYARQQATIAAELHGDRVASLVFGV